LTSTDTRPPAVILGFNIHGLAIARALADHGIDVHALTPYGRMAANATRFANVHHRPALNSDDFATSLVEFSDVYLQGRSAVLLPTNDKMVSAIAINWSVLADRYLLSWSNNIDLIMQLRSKDTLTAYCTRVNINHPVSTIVTGRGDFDELLFREGLPLIVKPTEPLSSFKAIIVNSVADLERLVLKYEADLPFVIQQYIDGDSSSLYFCAVYLDRGREVCSFTGQKLYAIPRSTGQGTVMTDDDNLEILELTRQFLNGLDISGPVAIEFKKDALGNYWLIEPNVGRTEYCVDLLIQSGLNMPLIEYLTVCGESITPESLSAMKLVTWYDTEKDPFCYLRHCLAEKRLFPLGKTPIFPYFGHRDLKPFCGALRLQSEAILKRLMPRRR
jgi:predicted ATP-grasp superfamily ATP-dependent carboligase